MPGEKCHARNRGKSEQNITDAEQFSQLLCKLGACEELCDWAKGKDLKAAWETCERADWMLWICSRMIGTVGWPTHQQVVLAECDCAETGLTYVTYANEGEKRPHLAIKTIRRWAHGKATLEEVRITAASADSAADDAIATASAGDVSAIAASHAAFAVAAVCHAITADNAEDAAGNAVLAADNAAKAFAASASDADVWRASLKQMADLIRERLRPGGAA